MCNVMVEISKSFVKQSVLYTTTCVHDEFPFRLRVDAIYDTVYEANYTHVTMTTNPAYESSNN